MIQLWRWYNKRIAIQILGDERVFWTTITWVTDLAPDYVWIHGVRYVSHISPELKNVSDVFIKNRLPDYFSSSFPNCLLLDAESGKWFYLVGRSERVPIIVAVDTDA